ncbi:MAG: hypothetical protein OES09_04225, partial [Gammaproteobacteria bacterium]|nr:hypothetical protein [Gammaproteobacteria bacterium]
MTKSKFGTLRSGFALDIAVVAQRAAAGVDEPAAATFVWDVQTQILFENADLERVAEIAGSKCPRCHGNDGITPPEDQD